MRVEGEVVQVIGTDFVIEIVTESGIDIENEIWIVKGRENGMVEVAGMGEGGWIGGLGMEEMEAGIGTVIEAGHVPLLDIPTGGHPGVQFARINELCR